MEGEGLQPEARASSWERLRALAYGDHWSLFTRGPMSMRQC